MKKVVIKDDKIPVVLSGHPWIFSGAIAQFEAMQPGELVHLVDSSGKFLALGYAHSEQSLFVRILAYKDIPIEALIKQRLQEAFELRKLSGLLETTNSYRLINAEGDRLGGLIVDVYDAGCVLQVSTWGIERLKPLIIKTLQELFKFEWIIERSESSSRAQEGLEMVKTTHLGHPPAKVLIFENDIQMQVDLEKGQKTGFFLDQRPMRMCLKQFCHNRSVLNMFSYTGGFSLHALSAGAASVTSVDVDKHALGLLDKMVEANAFESSRHKSVAQDAFEFLKQTDLSLFDLIILDPPAFAKKRQDVDNASKGYKKLFLEVLPKMKDGALLYAASCSYFVDKPLFEKLLLQAAMQAGVVLKQLSPQLEAIDHPRLLAHKEGTYLKGFLLQVFSS